MAHKKVISQNLKLDLPRIYPITDTRISGLSHLEQVKRLVAGGAKFIQLREKNASPRDFCEQALEVVEFARAQGVRIIINDRVDIALALKADGVHVGQDDLPPELVRQILGPEAIIGFSTHTIGQVIAAVELPIDYIAYGPIFQTTTKENPEPIIGTEAIKQIRPLVGNLPIVAIGGISGIHLRSVIEAGADSTAMIGAILSEPDNIAVQYIQFNTLANRSY